MTPTARALRIITSGERFHLIGAATVRGGFCLGPEAVVAHGDGAILVGIKPKRALGYSPAHAVAVQLQRRLRDHIKEGGR